MAAPSDKAPKAKKIPFAPRPWVTIGADIIDHVGHLVMTPRGRPRNEGVAIAKYIVELANAHAIVEASEDA